MKTLENIRNSINAIFDLYVINWKRLLSLSISFSLVSTGFSLIVGLIFFYLIREIYNFIDFTQSEDLSETIFSLIFDTKNLLIFTSIFVLNIAMYGIFLINPNSNFKGKQLTLKSLFNSISNRIWKQYALLLVLLFIMHLLLFNDLFKVEGYNDGINTILGVFDGQQSKLDKLNAWGNSIIELTMLFIPYVFALSLIIYFREGKITIAGLKKYRTAILTGLILSFFIEIFSENVFFYFKFYIITLFKIPFDNEFFPATIVSILWIIIVSYFVSAFAAAFAFPFYSKEEINNLKCNDTFIPEPGDDILV